MEPTIPFSLATRRIYIAGHRGLVGSALLRRLQSEGCQILVADRQTLDLTRQASVERWFYENRPEAVFLAAGRVGGIHENASYPAEFIYDNLAIACNVIEAARKSGVAKLMYFGSSCIYPRLAPQPMTEAALLTGSLEPTNEPYAVAKIAGLKLCQACRRQYSCDFVSVMPTNLYGPNDNFDLPSSHVLPALLAKIDQAVREGCETVEIWGTGTPRREFLHVDDLADAAVFLMQNWSEDEFVNIGAGTDVTIAELTHIIGKVVGYTGRFIFNRSKPDGAPRKLLDTSKLRKLGWEPRIDLETGIRQTYHWYRTAQHSMAA